MRAPELRDIVLFALGGIVMALYADLRSSRIRRPMPEPEIIMTCSAPGFDYVVEGSSGVFAVVYPSGGSRKPVPESRETPTYNTKAKMHVDLYPKDGSKPFAYEEPGLLCVFAVDLATRKCYVSQECGR